MKTLHEAAQDHATPSGGQEAGPQEDRIEAAYWRFDARHKGYSQWKTAPMSERDAFKAEMRNALEAEKVRAEMRLVARGWRRPDAPAAPAPVAQKAPDVNDLLLDALKKVSMNAVYVANNECSLTMSIVREVDAAIEKVSPTDHGIGK